MIYSLALAASISAQVAPLDHKQINHGTTGHSPVAAAVTGPPLEAKEPGQAAYASLGETVRILLADPNTDWSQVNVDLLRSHLVDMDNVTMRSSVAMKRLPNGARFVVTGTPEVAKSIQRMTRTHFAEPDVADWTMVSESRPDGAVVTVTSKNAVQAQKIVGLGFYGILTMGAHHQPHHVMMARGAMNH